jgi:hypothetical protein
MPDQYALPRPSPMTAGTPPVSPSSRAAHAMLDQTLGDLVKKMAPQFAGQVPADKAKQTLREVLKTGNFMEKSLIMSKIGAYLPKGVVPADIEKAVNEAPPPPEKPAAPPAPAPAPAAPAVASKAPEAPAVAPPATPATNASLADVQAGAGPAAVAAASAASRAGGGGAASAHYRKMREPFAAELKDPATRRLLKGIISAENPGAGSAVAESLMNRTAMVNEQRAAKGQPSLTLKSMIQGDPSIGGGQSFYGPVRTGAINQHLARVDADKNYAAQLDKHIDSALSGADTIKGNTDQGSKGDPNYDAGGVGININGERFNDWGYSGARAWREKNQALAAANEPLDPTPNVGSGQSDYDAAASTASASTTTPDTTNTAAAPDLSPGPKLTKSKGEAIGDIFSGIGDIMAKGPVAQNAARPSSPANLPLASLPMPQGPVPMVDPRLADAQRQQLAAAMQRLNSGRLV